MNENTTAGWQLLQKGIAFNRRIGLYETVRRNEQFYRGEQWAGTDDALPHPVFNLIRRITDHLIGAVVPNDLSIHFTDDRLPFLENAAIREAVSNGISLLNRSASYRWKENRLDDLSYHALLDAALTGDGVFYCWWDQDCKSGQAFFGDIRTELIPTANFFVADPQCHDVQKQDYVLLSGRATVSSLQKEAMEAGVPSSEWKKILPDSEDGDPALSETDLHPKATFILRFWKENGEVMFEKSTRNCIIRRCATGLKHYPIAYFNWFPSRSSFHGSAPVTELIPNQKYINAAYALVMKHMSDTAFSKVIYDSSRIPEWTNEVGEAIAAVGGGDVSDAVSVVGVGKMQDGYLDLIQNVIENTKAMMSVTDSAVGDEHANNTSAILALQEASAIGLRQVKARFTRCMEDLASIWADMICTYSPAERLLPVPDQNGEIRAEKLDYELMRKELLHATAEVTSKERYATGATVSLLQHLLDNGHITLSQYLRHLPEGCIGDRNALIQEIQKKGEVKNE